MKPSRQRSAFNAAVGARLRNRRLKVNIGQDAVAKEIGCAVSTISRYESGAYPCEAETLAKLARIYGCDPGDFVNGIEAK